MLTTWAVPFAVSDLRGFLLFWLGSVAYLGPPCLAVAIGARKIGSRYVRWLSWTVPFSVALVLGVLVAALLMQIRAFVAGRDVQFLARAAAIETALGTTIVTGAVLVHHRVTGWLRERWSPDLRTQRRLLGSLLALSGLVAMIASATHLMALHLLEAATAVGTLGACSLTASAALLLPLPIRRGGWALGGLLVAPWLLLPVRGPAADHAAFLRYAHAPTTGGLASVLRYAADFDGDGAAPWFLGGSDCEEGNSSRGPLVQDIPSDGIDQDCRGGDASAIPLRDHPGELIPDCRPITEPLSILLITIDAMRADMLRRDLTPSLLQFAHHSIVFPRAYSPSTMTNASMAAIFFGRPYSKIRAMPDSGQGFRGRSIVANLREAGLETAAFNRLALDPALIEGFSQVNPVPVDVRHELDSRPLHSVAQSRAVLSWLGAAGSQRFVWVHYGDAHAPYRVPPILEGGPTGYPAAFRYIDLQIGYLLGEMSHRGLLGKYVVAVTSDHGEDLGQRMREGHGPNLYEESIRVPLILWIPGCRPRVESSPVSLVSLMPTLAQLLGEAAETLGLWEGMRVGVPVVAEEGTERSFTFKRAVIAGDFKLVVDVRSGGRVLFDLVNDGLEGINAYRVHPEAAGRMEGAYRAWIDDEYVERGGRE